MSDKIKDEYVKYVEKIRPSEEFESRLTGKLEEEAARRAEIKKNTLGYRRLLPVFAAAACLAAALAAALLIFRGGAFLGPAEIRPTASGIGSPLGEVNTDVLHTGSFTDISWYDGSLAASGLPSALAEKMARGLDYLAYNGENKFVEADIADKGRIDEIMALLEAVSETDGKPSGEKIYYMAVFTDGTVAKFSVTAGSFVEISGYDKIYKKTGK